MEDEYQINEYQEENTERPKFLLVLCIMTILNTGLTLVNGLFSLFSAKPSEVEIAKANSQISKKIENLHETFRNGVSFLGADRNTSLDMKAALNFVKKSL